MLNGKVVVVSSEQSWLEDCSRQLADLEFLVFGEGTKKVEVISYLIENRQKADFFIDSELTYGKYAVIVLDYKEDDEFGSFVARAVQSDSTLRFVLVCEHGTDNLDLLAKLFTSDENWLFVQRGSRAALRRSVSNMLACWSSSAKSKKAEKTLEAEKNNIEQFSATLNKKLSSIINDMNRKSSFLRRLFDFTELLVVQKSLDGVLESIAVFVKEVLVAERVSIMLKEGDYLTIKASVGLPEETPRKIYVGKGISGHVFEKNRPVFAKNLNELPESLRGGWSSSSSYISSPIALAPLGKADNPTGVINVTDKADKKPFNEDDLEMLTFISHLANIAISNQNYKQQNITH